MDACVCVSRAQGLRAHARERRVSRRSERTRALERSHRRNEQRTICWGRGGLSYRGVRGACTFTRPPHAAYFSLLWLGTQVSRGAAPEVANVLLGIVLPPHLPLRTRLAVKASALRCLAACLEVRGWGALAVRLLRSSRDSECYLIPGACSYESLPAYLTGWSALPSVIFFPCISAVIIVGPCHLSGTSAGFRRLAAYCSRSKTHN